jgi:hypothetical protein
MVILPPHGDRSPFRAGALDSMRTGLTGLHGKLDLHHLVGAVIDGGAPASARRPARAGGPLRRPIDREIARVKPLGGSRWPFAIGPHRTEELYAVLALTGDQQFCIERARLDDMRGG